MHFFRIILTILFLTISFSSNYAQDSNTVYYSLFFPKTVSFGTIDTKIEEGIFKEGSSFLIPENNLTGSDSIYQDLYNALVGGRFSIDYGALNNDIIMKIYIRNLDPNVGKYLDLGIEDDTLFSYFEIEIWELPDSNYYHEDSSYYFNDGFYARLALPKSEALLNFLNILGISNQDSLAFAFLENSNDGVADFNGFGIETIDEPDSIKFKAIHLSRIGGGRGRIASSNTVLGIGIKELNGVPEKINLGQNYPNPFNPTTKISYSIYESGNVKLDVYNILGEHILSLVDRYQSSGNYEVELSTNDISNTLRSGLYIYTLESNKVILSKKMILMK